MDLNLLKGSLYCRTFRLTSSSDTPQELSGVQCTRCQGIVSGAFYKKEIPDELWKLSPNKQTHKRGRDDETNIISSIQGRIQDLKWLCSLCDSRPRARLPLLLLHPERDPVNRCSRFRSSLSFLDSFFAGVLLQENWTLHLANLIFCLFWAALLTR